MPDCVQHPYIVPEDASSICTTGLMPHILTGVFLQIIRHHFSDASNIIQEPLNGYIWNSDPAESKISIETAYNWKVDTIQQRPAVVVKRGQLKTKKMSMGNIFHGSPEETGYAEEQMIVAFTGSHTFFCAARTGTEAELMGAEVAFELLEFSQIIRQQFNLMMFDLFEIGQIHRLQESHDHYMVPITVSYGYSHGWRVLRQRPIWMSIGIDISATE